MEDVVDNVTVSQLEHMVLTDTLGLEDDVLTRSLEPPLRDSAPSSVILGSPSKTRPYSVMSSKNTRKRMEDRHVVLHDLKAYLPSALQSKIESEEHVSYYAVFDGHAGTDAAAYAAAHLHELLVESQHYPADPVAAFTESFLTCDERFVSSTKKSGTTAVSVLVKGQTVYVAWLGDSQATLVRSGQSVKIMDSHKPNREDERARVEGLGGSIMFWGTWRVNGQLAVSRAIGDGEYKPYISAQPDVTTIVLNGTEDFMIIACDGLWDMVSPEEATELVYSYLEEEKGDLDSLGVHLSKVAKDKGSGDNITIIVIFFKSVVEVRKREHLVEEGKVDLTGIKSTSDYVFSTDGVDGRDSLGPIKESAEVPLASPGINFSGLDRGGGMFSPDPFGQGGQNGFDISSENFDTRLSNEQSGRFSEENGVNGSYAICAQVDYLLAMLDREDCSPNQEEDDRPLEEILAAAREREEEEIEGVETVDSEDEESEDEVVEHRTDIEGVETVDGEDEESEDEVVELRTKPEEKSRLQEDIESGNLERVNGLVEPRMDPCEQVTVVATGPDECGTVVPPSQELPSLQEPESVELANSSPGIMSCSMVKEENGGTDTGVSFSDESGEDSGGFMLKTPGVEEQKLAEFVTERETSVDTGEEVNVDEGEDDSTDPEVTQNELVDDDDLPVGGAGLVTAPPSHDLLQSDEGASVDSSLQSEGGGLNIPTMEITPATPTKARSRSPEDSPAQVVVFRSDIPDEVTEKPLEDKTEVNQEVDLPCVVIPTPEIITTPATPTIQLEDMLEAEIPEASDVEVPEQEPCSEDSENASLVPTITTTPATPTLKKAVLDASLEVMAAHEVTQEVMVIAESATEDAELYGNQENTTTEGIHPPHTEVIEEVASSNQADALVSNPETPPAHPTASNSTKKVPASASRTKTGGRPTAPVPTKLGATGKSAGANSRPSGTAVKNPGTKSSSAGSTAGAKPGAVGGARPKTTANRSPGTSSSLASKTVGSTITKTAAKSTTESTRTTTSKPVPSSSRVAATKPTTGAAKPAGNRVPVADTNKSATTKPSTSSRTTTGTMPSKPRIPETKATTSREPRAKPALGEVKPPRPALNKPATTAAKSTGPRPTVSRTSSNASSLANARPGASSRPATSAGTSRVAGGSGVPATGSRAAASQSGSSTASKTVASQPNSATSSRTGSAASSGRPTAGVGRTPGAASSRATTSSNPSKPTAAASRVAAARAAVKVANKGPGAKVLRLLFIKDKDKNVEDKKNIIPAVPAESVVNGDVTSSPDSGNGEIEESDVINDNEIEIPGDKMPSNSEEAKDKEPTVADGESEC